MAACAAARRWGARNTLITVVPCLLIVGACVTTRDAPRFNTLSAEERRALSFLTEPAPRDDCHTLDRPERLDELLDTSAVLAVARRIEADPSAHVVFAVRWGADSIGTARELARTGLSGGAADTLAAALSAALVRAGDEPPTSPHRIRVRVGAAALLEAGSAVMCPPALLNRDSIGAALYRALEGRSIRTGIAEPGQRPMAVVWLYITEGGGVGRTRLDQSSGDPRFDNVALGVADVARFAPALVDGAPSAEWVVLPVMDLPLPAERGPPR
jgi:TonB family protein